MFTHVAVNGTFDIRRKEVGGLPVYWADLPPPCTASLVFRVGRCDERLSIAGITHLVEHLALFELESAEYDVGGFVDEVRTTFTARGTREEVLMFLRQVASRLTALPLERAEQERQVLLAEASLHGPGTWDHLLDLRFGATGHGMLGHPEYGLHRLTVGEIGDWARQRFTAGNAGIWITTDPSGIEVGLPPGPRHVVESPQERPGLELPAYLNEDRPDVAMLLVAPRSVAFAAGISITSDRLSERLRRVAAISYEPGGSYIPLTADLASACVRADSRPRHATQVRDEILRTLKELASGNARDEELAAEVRGFERQLRDPDAVPSELDHRLLDELLGAPRQSANEVLEELRAVAPAQVAAALSQALSTAILVAPDDTPPPPPPFVQFSPRRPGPLRGRSHRPRIASLPVARDRTADLRASEAGVSMVLPDGDHRTIPWDACEAVLCEADRNLTIIAGDASSLELDLSKMRDTHAFVSLLLRKVPADRIMHVDDEAHGWLAVEAARDDLRHGWGAHEELRILGRHLHPGERISRMAQCKIGVLKAGVLAVTDRRLIFVRAGIVESGNQILEFPREAITSIAARSGHRMVGGAVLTVNAGAQKARFTEIVPRERAGEIARILSAPAG